MERLTPQLLLDYLVELGTALMSAGCPTHRLEELLVTLARLEGHTADVFAVPTGLFIGLRTPEGQASLTTMVRVREWSNDLERMWALDQVMNEVVNRTLSIPEARQRIREVLARPAPWSVPLELLAAAASSAGAAINFGGSLAEALLAGLGGLVLRALMFSLRQQPGVRVLENFIGGFVAAMFGWVSTVQWPGHSREVLVLSVIIPLLPGLTLTTGLAELTYRNLVAGTARMMHAAVTLLSLVFGIAVVVGLENSVGVHASGATLAREAAPFWLQAIALLCAAFGFGVLLGLPRKKLGIALASSTLVWVVSAMTRPLSGPHAAFLNALVLAVGANAWARATFKPAQVFQMPGMLLLVPGALSFRSFETMLSGNAVVGLSGLADVVLIAGALVMGLLVANVALPANKVL